MIALVSSGKIRRSREKSWLLSASQSGLVSQAVLIRALQPTGQPHYGNTLMERHFRLFFFFSSLCHGSFSFSRCVKENSFVTSQDSFSIFPT